MTFPVMIPPEFAGMLQTRPAEPDLTGVDWLARLPRLVRAALDRWDLTVAGQSRYGECALVIPVRRPDGSTGALKVTWPHPDAAHEHLALRAYRGRGAVRLLAADPSSWTLLLEWLTPDRDLTELPVEAACITIGVLLRVLDRPALPQLQGAGEVLDRMRTRLEPGAPASVRLPRRFVDQALSLATELGADPVHESRLVHADLHFGNVLRAGSPAREGAVDDWVSIDPKPVAADLAYGVWPALHNRWAEATADGDPRWHLHQRLGWLCDAAGIDEDRARAWAIVRTVADVAGVLVTDPGLDLTRAVTLLKALQPG